MIEKMPRRLFLIVEIITLLICAGLVYLVVIIFYPYTIIWYSILWLIGALTVLTVFGYIPLYFLNFKFIIDNDYVVLKSGVFFEKQQFLYRDKICYASVYNNPFTKILSVSTLVVGAAGGNIIIPLIDSKNSKKLQQVLCKTEFKDYEM